MLVVGAGGLGSPLLLYLAAAGVGTIGIVDDDRVDLSNLQRQIVHATGSVGELKVESARGDAGAAQSDGVRIEAHRAAARRRRTPPALIGALRPRRRRQRQFRDALSAERPLRPVEEAAGRRGAVAVRRAALDVPARISATGHPCYRCLFREPPPPDMVPRCEEAGILGAVAGVIGTLQATEVFKELLGIGESLAGTLLIYDALRVRFHRIRIAKDPDCPTCGVKALAKQS